MLGRSLAWPPTIAGLFATIAEPLTRLTRKMARFEWTEEAQQAFDALKKALVETTSLAFPFPYFYIHLQLHRLLVCCRPKCSAVGLVHCASSSARFAVGIVALRCEQCSPIRHRLCNLHRFLMLPTTEAGQTLAPHLCLCR